MQLLHLVKFFRGKVGVSGGEVRFQLCNRTCAWNGAVHCRIGQHEAHRGLTQRLAWALEEPELLDPREAQLELISLRPAPLLLGWNGYARFELAGEQATG